MYMCLCVCVLVSVSGSCPELMYNLRRKFIFKLLPLAVSFHPNDDRLLLSIHTETRRLRSLTLSEQVSFFVALPLFTCL